MIVIGETRPAVEPFLDKQKCKKIIANKTCFKSVKGSCIDLFLTSKPSLHQFANVFEREIRDYYLLTYTRFSLPILRGSQTFLQRDVLRTYQNNPPCKI